MILSLSILVVLHELGHFIPAKLFKTKVEKFYLFFDPWFSLFKVKKGETEYGIGWLPLGGYVKIAGMIDESMDKDAMKKPAEPWEFRSKPAWQRLIIMIGGVTVNLILGVLIYAMVLFTWGEQHLAPENAIYGISTDSIGRNMGFQDGDMILSVDNKKVKSFGAVTHNILFDKAKTVQVQRAGEKVELYVNEETIHDVIAFKSSLISPRIPFYVDSLIPDYPAIASGLKKGDQFIRINEQSAAYFQDAVKLIRAHKNEEITMEVLRGGDTLQFSAIVSNLGTLGIKNKGPNDLFKIDSVEYGFFASFPASINMSVTTVVDYVKQMKLIFTVEDAYQEIGSFATIGNAFSSTWNWRTFWNMTGLLSFVLAVMNILPIPALDGGHVMFLLYEMIAGRPPQEKVLEYAQYVGMILLITVMLFAIKNDVVRFLL